MEKEFNSEDYQGRTENQVRNNNLIYGISMIVASLIGMAVSLYVIFNNIFE
jgi:hypothetical protein